MVISDADNETTLNIDQAMMNICPVIVFIDELRKIHYSLKNNRSAFLRDLNCPTH